jgi:putative glutamine amidotransferase
MQSSLPLVRIGVYGSEIAASGRGVGLWAPGYHNTLTAAGAQPVAIPQATGDETWDEIFDSVQGIVLCGFRNRFGMSHGDEESMCLWCRHRRVPLLAIDQGMLALNSAFGGSNYLDLAREFPDGIQHRHPPEPGIRHAINVEPGTMLAQIYGEGEIVVNSEHRQAVHHPASGFRVSAKALDGVIEGMEYVNDAWFALGIQWQPASISASGLDIQIFRGLIEAAAKRPVRLPKRKLAVA